MVLDRNAVRTLATNRKARYEYEIIEELECGLELRGTEVKSLRQGRASIEAAFGLVRRGELLLVGAHIPEYAHGNIHNHVPDRDRRLLAHAREIARLERGARERGTSIVPLELYFKGSRVKLRVALARGKKQYDKREAKKKHDARRDIDRALSRRR